MSHVEIDICPKCGEKNREWDYRVKGLQRRCEHCKHSYPFKFIQFVSQGRGTEPLEHTALSTESTTVGNESGEGVKSVALPVQKLPHWYFSCFRRGLDGFIADVDRVIDREVAAMGRGGAE